MRWHARAHHLVFGLILALYALGMSWPGEALAQQEHIPRGQPIPQNIRWVNATATGANTSASAMWTDALGRTTHHKFPVSVSAATLGRLANAAVRRGLPLVGWGLTFKGLLDAAGWAIDELQQQVVNPGTPQQPLGDVAYCIVDYTGQFRCATGPGMLSRVAHLVAPPGAFQQPCRAGSQVWGAGGERGYFCIRSEDMAEVQVFIDQRVWRPTAGWEGYINDTEYVPPETIGDADLGNMIKHTPEVVNAVLIDPDTGAPIRTQELTDALNNLRRGLEAANGLPPGTDLDPATDYAEPTPSETEFPEFCMWADTVCDFIDWWKQDAPEEPTPEVPWQEELPADIEQPWSSGLGGGSCPAPHQFSVSLGGQTANPEFDYTPICSFGSTMRPVLIAMATIVAGFIIAGVRGAKDA